MLVSARNGHEAESAQQPVARPTAAQDRSVSRNEPHTNHSAVTRSASFEFRRAIKRDAKIRFAICGPSGSGKTYSLLRLATELGGPVALGLTLSTAAPANTPTYLSSMCWNSDLYDPTRLIQIIDYAAGKGYRVLCIDSLSHFWMGKGWRIGPSRSGRAKNAEPQQLRRLETGNPIAQRINRQADQRTAPYLGQLAGEDRMDSRPG